MRLIQAVAIVLVALLVAGCASTPPPPRPFVLRLESTPRADFEPHVLATPIRVDDRRDVPDPTRIGEVHAPGAAPLVGPGTREGAAATAALQILMLANPLPTGRYLIVADSADVARAVEHALTHALLQSNRYRPGSGVLEATVRKFWMRPSWTTTCDVAVEVRLLGSGGKAVWERTIEGRVDKFEGWFTQEAFERVARMALDRFGAQAADAFGSVEFAAALAAGGSVHGARGE